MSVSAANMEHPIGNWEFPGLGMTQYQKMGEWLVQAGLVSRERLDQALRAQRSSKGRLGEILTSMGLITEQQVLDCLSQQYELPVEKLGRLTIEPEALRAVGSQTALAFLVLPHRITETDLHCVVSDPIDVRATDELIRLTRKRIVMTLASPTELYQAIIRAFSLPWDTPAADQPKTKRKPAKARKQEDRSQLLLLLQDGQGEPSLWEKFGGRSA